MFAQKSSNQSVEVMGRRTATNVNWIMQFVRAPKVVLESQKRMMVDVLENVRTYVINFINMHDNGIFSVFLICLR